MLPNSSWKPMIVLRRNGFLVPVYLFLSLSLSLSLSLTHTHTHTPYTLSLSFTLHTLSLSFILHTHTHTHTLSLTFSLSIYLSLCRYLSLTIYIYIYIIYPNMSWLADRCIRLQRRFCKYNNKFMHTYCSFHLRKYIGFKEFLSIMSTLQDRSIDR